MRKAIIFDFFGVVCNDIGSLWLSGRFDAEQLDALKRDYFLPLDLGDRTERELLEMLGTATSQTPEEVEGQMYGTLKVDSEVVSHILELRSHYKLGLCSNAARDIFDHVTTLGNLRVADLFDEVVVSGDIKVAKPDPRIFMHTLEVLGVSPEEAIFIDDNIKNVEAARALGIHGILFTSAQDLRKELELI